MFKLKKVTVIVLIVFTSKVANGQLRKFMGYEIEYGLRVARTSGVFARSVPFLEEDFGVHFFDGFFVRITQAKFSCRLGLGYFSNNYIFPYYEKPTKYLTYTKTNFVQFFAGLQYKPGKQKLFYALADVDFTQVKKEGVISGIYGPFLYINTFRRSFGLSSGCGIQRTFWNFARLSLEYHLSAFLQRSRATQAVPFSGGLVFHEENKVSMKYPSSIQLFITFKLP